MRAPGHTDLLMTTHWLDDGTWMVEAAADTGEFAVFLSDSHVEISASDGSITDVAVPAGLDPGLASVSQASGWIRVLIPRRPAT